MYLHYTVFLPVGWHPSNLKGEADKMRRLALAIALACVLISGTAGAGEIHSGDRAPQPSSSPVSTSEITGGTDSTNAETPEASSTVLTIILTLISIVP
jgi:hypothetical protein